MGILVITWNFPPRRGGIERLVANLCGELRKRHSLHVVTAFAQARWDKEGVFRAALPGLPSFCLYALLKGAFLLWRDPQVEIVLGGSAIVTPLVLMLARLFRRKSIVLAHGLDVVYPSSLYQTLCVRWLKFCDRVVANSRFTALLVGEKGVGTERICVIPPGVRLGCETFPEPQAAKRETGLEGRKVLLFVGRLAGRKGLKEFLERSFVWVVSEVPETCLVVVGDNPRDSLVHQGDLLGDLIQIVRTKRLSDHVQFFTSVDDSELSRLYAASDLMILPALSMKNDIEGFGIVLLEAAAAGKPCVATRVGGIPDVIEHGKSGILVEPGDYELMSRTIVRLLQDEKTRLALGEYARKRASEKFSWSAIIKKYEEVFDSLRA